MHGAYSVKLRIYIYLVSVFCWLMNTKLAAIHGLLRFTTALKADSLWYKMDPADLPPSYSLHHPISDLCCEVRVS